MTDGIFEDVDYVMVANADVSLGVAVTGTGPLILCIHGWPELWYSWRHQMKHFAARGFTVAALDVRGYGKSSNPREIAAYSMKKLTSDAAAVIDALSGDAGNGGQAIVFGHDWGAPIAWNTARLHPGKVSAVAGLSVPYFPIAAENSLDRWRKIYTDQGKFFYQVYFDDNVGGAEAELAADSLTSIRKIYYAACGASSSEPFLAERPLGQPLLDGFPDPDPFPDWASDGDLRVYAEAMDVSGWHGPLNRYRAQAIDAKELGSLPDPNLTQPAAFIGGEFDVVRGFAPGVDPYDFAGMSCDDFRGSTIVEGAGHWVQQEAPEATNAALDGFIDGL